MKDDIFATLFYSNFLEEYIQYEENEELAALSSKQLELDQRAQSMSQEIQDFLTDYITIQNQINRQVNCTYFKTGFKLGIALIKG